MIVLELDVGSVESFRLACRAARDVVDVCPEYAALRTTWAGAHAYALVVETSGGGNGSSGGCLSCYNLLADLPRWHCRNGCPGFAAFLFRVHAVFCDGQTTTDDDKLAGSSSGGTSLVCYRCFMGRSGGAGHAFSAWILWTHPDFGAR